MVIFGAAGDLTRRKLIPALYNLAKSESAVPRVRHRRSRPHCDDRRGVPQEDLARTSRSIATGDVDPELWEWFVRPHVLRDAAILTTRRLYRAAQRLLEKVDRDHATHGNYFFYLATAAEFFRSGGRAAGRSRPDGRERGSNWRRVIIEKPFGHDLESARALNQQLLQVASEKQIYRIDHYLGKETVQNILVFRFANGIFEPIWNRRYIDHVQITVAETVGRRAARQLLRHAPGALRDMVPNHIMQLISLTAMEPPVSFQADAVRDEQAKILHAIQPLSPEEVLTRTVRGQYGEGDDRRRTRSRHIAHEPDVPAIRAPKPSSP